MESNSEIPPTRHSRERGNPDKSISEIQINWLSLFLIIFLEGFISISVEILTIRQMVPFVGNSVVVTSLIIGIFLLFLAFGYYRGGLYRENYSHVLRRNFTLSAVFLGLGLSYYFMKLFFYSFAFVFTDNAIIALVIYLFLITAPLIYLLGQTVPITTNLFKYEHHIGTISGKVLSLSTLGSFLGAVVTAAILMNFFGVAWTIMINLIGLIALVIALTPVQLGEFWRYISLFFLVGLVYIFNVEYEHFYFVKTNHYNSYRVVDTQITSDGRKGKALLVNDSASSFIDVNNKGFTYIERIKEILFKELQLTNKDILVLGAGGFSLSAESTFGNRFVYNDIDKNIKQVTKENLHTNINGKFIADDARKLLMYANAVFDVVVVDVFNHQHAIPFHLLTKEHFQNLRRILREGGYVVFNVIARPTLSDRYSKRIDNTIRSVFPSCMIMPMRYNTSIENIIYVCNVARRDQDKLVYTDDLNSATIDFYSR